MKTPWSRTLSALALAAHFLAASAFSAEVGNHKLSEWKLGKVLFGEKISKTEFKGKVVVNCPPCVASLPHLAELDKKHRADGLRIIGAESQGSSKEQIKPLIEKAKVEYTIIDEASGPIAVTGIPRAFVFDRDGKLVYDGHPAAQGFDESITKALGATEAAPAAPATTAITPAHLIAMRSWTNSEGREIRAAVTKADETTVIFEMAGGREISYPLEKLSEESRQVIAEATKAAP